MGTAYPVGEDTVADDTPVGFSFKAYLPVLDGFFTLDRAAVVDDRFALGFAGTANPKLSMGTAWRVSVVAVRVIR